MRTLTPKDGNQHPTASSSWLLGTKLCLLISCVGISERSFGETNETISHERDFSNRIAGSISYSFDRNDSKNGSLWTLVVTTTNPLVTLALHKNPPPYFLQTYVTIEDRETLFRRLSDAGVLKLAHHAFISGVLGEYLWGEIKNEQISYGVLVGECLPDRIHQILRDFVRDLEAKDEAAFRDFVSNVQTKGQGIRENPDPDKTGEASSKMSKERPDSATPPNREKGREQPTRLNSAGTDVF